MLQEISVNNKQIICENYSKIKKQKKSPKNYIVFDDNPFIVIHKDKQNHGYNNYVGVLSELFDKI